MNIYKTKKIGDLYFPVINKINDTLLIPKKQEFIFSDYNGDKLSFFTERSCDTWCDSYNDIHKLIEKI